MKRSYLFGVSFVAIAVVLARYAYSEDARLWLLAWPAVAFGAVGFAYLSGNVRVFGKRADGSRHVVARILLAPYLGFASLVWHLQLLFKRDRAWGAVNDSLVVSRRLRGHEIPEDVRRIIDLTSEILDPRAAREMPGYVSWPLLDGVGCDSQKLISFAKSYPPDSQQLLLVHCANGHGRTGMFATVWLLTHGFATDVDEALQMISDARVEITLASEQRAVVEEAAKYCG